MCVCKHTCICNQINICIRVARRGSKPETHADAIASMHRLLLCAIACRCALMPHRCTPCTHTRTMHVGGSCNENAQAGQDQRTAVLAVLRAMHQMQEGLPGRVASAIASVMPAQPPAPPTAQPLPQPAQPDPPKPHSSAGKERSSTRRRGEREQSQYCTSSSTNASSFSHGQKNKKKKYRKKYGNYLSMHVLYPCAHVLGVQLDVEYLHVLCPCARTIRGTAGQQLTDLLHQHNAQKAEERYNELAVFSALQCNA